MTTATLSIGKATNAGFGDFVPVSVEIDGRAYGCDAHLGTGEAYEITRNPGSRPASQRDFRPRVELLDWEDGNGLVGNGHATEAEVWDAVKAAGHEVA